MTDALLLVAVVSAVAACPLMMWWNARRGRASACCPSPPARDETPTAADLRQRLQEIDSQIAEHDAATRGSYPT